MREKNPYLFSLPTPNASLCRLTYQCEDKGSNTESKSYFHNAYAHCLNKNKIDALGYKPTTVQCLYLQTKKIHSSFFRIPIKLAVGD